MFVTARFRPLCGHALLLDDQPEQTEGGVIVSRRVGCHHLDFLVVDVNGPAGFGVGDRVVLSDPNIGKRVMVDGTVYRMVSVGDVLALCLM